ncbi:MAG: TetR/AcrR family transcriptional regulator [Candidatus Stygibacter australis]|nr:TetR/AcrR family transcriptional regulator [Candidatus Stygibacter australis]MDP8321814.1 TetR/AcrR family transcriptional regulator [Candidatus Stygibacter australis]
MGTSERKERERELRKRSILTAAHRIFMEKGFDNTTMDDIADAVELSKGAVYFYFKSKSELCLSILLESLKVISASFDQISGEAIKGIDKLKKIFDVYYDFQEENPQFLNAIINFRHHRADCDHESEILQATLQENDKINIILKNCIVSGKADGSIDNTLNEEMLANSLWGQINGLLPNMILANKEHNEIYHTSQDLYKFSNSLIIKAIQR